MRIIGVRERDHQPLWDTWIRPIMYMVTLAEAIAPLAACCTHSDCHEYRVRFPSAPGEGKLRTGCFSASDASSR